MATTRLMPLHIGKGRTVSTAIADIIDYAENPEKTGHGKYIYGYECDTRTADAEFALSKRQYFNLTGRKRGADDVIAYHLRQSFKPGDSGSIKIKLLEEPDTVAAVDGTYQLEIDIYADLF